MSIQPNFWKSITGDQDNFLEKTIGVLLQNNISFCVIGGQAINAYTNALVGLDWDIVASGDSAVLERSLRSRSRFVVQRSPHDQNSITVLRSGSALRIHIHTNEAYYPFIKRSEIHDLLGFRLPVASPEDILCWIIQKAIDLQRSSSQRQKDLADIARLIEQYPHLKEQVPPEISKRLLLV